MSKLDIFCQLNPDTQTLFIGGDGGDIVSIPQAENLVAEIQSKIDELKARKVPPAPEPFFLAKDDPEAFAHVVNSVEEVPKYGSAIDVHAVEFYLEDLVGFRDWCNKVISYYGDAKKSEK